MIAKQGLNLANKLNNKKEVPLVSFNRWLQQAGKGLR
jgi:hypothetical protein